MLSRDEASGHIWGNGWHIGGQILHVRSE